MGEWHFTCPPLSSENLTDHQAQIICSLLETDWLSGLSVQTHRDFEVNTRAQGIRDLQRVPFFICRVPQNVPAISVARWHSSLRNVIYIYFSKSKQIRLWARSPISLPSPFVFWARKWCLWGLGGKPGDLTVSHFICAAQLLFLDVEWSYCQVGSSLSAFIGGGRGRLSCSALGLEAGTGVNNIILFSPGSYPGSPAPNVLHCQCVRVPVPGRHFVPSTLPKPHPSVSFLVSLPFVSQD